ncbi:MAG: chromate transporter [Acholeplasma sp.]|nr:MAG: chromate transporter [Acholeplasma sp.]
MVSLLTIFLVFFKIGAFTFGGGLAMIPIIKRDIVSRGWIEENELMDYIAVAQVAPGMIAINIAVLVGEHIRGRRGSLVAVLGVALPSLIVITLIAALLKEFADIELVQFALKGILMTVVVLLFSAMIELGKKNIYNIWLLMYAILGFSAVFFFNISTVLIILTAFLLGSIHAYILFRKKVKLWLN